MTFVDSSNLFSLLSQWGDGSLDVTGVDQHVLAGVEGCTVSFRGLTAQTLVQRFTSEDVNQALHDLAIAGHQGSVIALVCIYLLGWTVDRLARAMNHPDASHTQTYLIQAGDLFAGRLLNG